MQQTVLIAVNSGEAGEDWPARLGPAGLNSSQPNQAFGLPSHSFTICGRVVDEE